MQEKIKHKKKKSYRYLLLVIISITILLSFFCISWFINYEIQPIPLKKYAKDILTFCKRSSNSEICYNSAIPKLMDKPSSLSMEEVFQVTKAIQKTDTTYIFCHVLGHTISAKETKKNPADWQNVVARCPQGICSNGCIHGAFQERFRKEALSDIEIETHKKEFTTVCQTSSLTSRLAKGSCTHALGHLFMYISNADIKKSVTLCDEIAKNSADICYDGTFMQIFQPLESEDYWLIRNIHITKNNVYTFCSQFEPQVKLSCWRESWPLHLKQIMQPKGLEDFCNTLDIPLQNRCFNSLFYIIPVQLHFTAEKIVPYCMRLSKNLQAECLGIAAVRFIQNDYTNADVAIRFCKNITSTQLQYSCFTTLSHYASFIFPTDGQLLQRFCSSLPKPYETSCTQNNQKN